MYLPKHFAVSEHDEAFRFIEANAFGQLISTVQGRHYSSHIPFLVSDDKTKLYAHLAKQNPQHSELGAQEVLVSLQGAHDYISPSWYESPGVPTWNYQAVHIYGEATCFNDPEKLRQLVNSLTAKYEASSKNPWTPDYKDAMLNAIVGIEISISDIQCKYKLSQNRPAGDRANVIDQLRAKGSLNLAAAMAKSEDKNDD